MSTYGECPNTPFKFFVKMGDVSVVAVGGILDPRTVRFVMLDVSVTLKYRHAENQYQVEFTVVAIYIMYLRFLQASEWTDPLFVMMRLVIFWKAFQLS